MSDLLKKYINILLESDVDSLGYNSQKLKRRVINKFGVQIEFLHPQNKSHAEIIFICKVLEGQIIEIGISFQEQKGENLASENQVKDENENISIYHATKFI